MKKKVNLFTENSDLQFYIRQYIDWEPFVKLLEKEFDPSFDSPYSSVEEAVEFYYEVLKLVGEISGTSIMPRAKTIDKEGNKFENGKVIMHPETLASLKELSESNIFGMSIHREYGGQNMSSVVGMLTTEILSTADGSMMTIYGLTDGVAETIERFGDHETKERIIPELVAGKLQGSMALTEDLAGSDLGAVACKAYQKDGKWFINGTKKFITNAPAHICLVLARSDESSMGTTKGLSLLMVELDETVEIISLEDKLGIKGSPTCMMVFKDSPATLLGIENEGFKHMLTLMNMARLGVAAQATGIAQAALSEAVAYAAERIQFGVTIDKHGLVQDLITQMILSVESSRALVVLTAVVSDYERGYRMKVENMSESDPAFPKLKKESNFWTQMLYLLTPLSKYWATEQSVLTTSQAMQVMGGNGYTKDYPIERYYRDARVTTIYEGTTEVQVMFAMKSLCRGGEVAQFLDQIEQYCEAKDAGSDVESTESESSEEVEYSLDYSSSDEEEGTAALSLYAKLKQCKTWLVDAAQILQGYMIDTRSDVYLRLKSRDIAEMGVIVIVGYEFLKQAEKSERKAKIAHRWITDMYPRAQLLHGRIESMDMSVIDDFELIAHGEN